MYSRVFTNTNLEFCQICMSTIKPKTCKLILTCEHKFHYGCFITMIKLDDSFSLNECVICKKNLEIPYFSFETDTKMKTIDGDCPICLNELGYEKDIKSLPCEHIFHSKCINRWFRIKNNCPMCREVDEGERYRTYSNIAYSDEEEAEVSNNIVDIGGTVSVNEVILGITGVTIELQPRNDNFNVISRTTLELLDDINTILTEQVTSTMVTLGITNDS